MMLVQASEAGGQAREAGGGKFFYLQLELFAYSRASLLIVP